MRENEYRAMAGMTTRDEDMRNATSNGETLGPTHCLVLLLCGLYPFESVLLAVLRLSVVPFSDKHLVHMLAKRLLALF